MFGLIRVFSLSNFQLTIEQTKSSRNVVGGSPSSSSLHRLLYILTDDQSANRKLFFSLSRPFNLMASTWCYRYYKQALVTMQAALRTKKFVQNRQNRETHCTNLQFDEKFSGATTEKCTIADDDGEWEFSIWFVFLFCAADEEVEKRNKTFAQETSFDGGSGTFPSFQFLNWGHFTPIVPHTTHRIWIQFPKWNRIVQHEADEEESIDEEEKKQQAEQTSECFTEFSSGTFFSIGSRSKTLRCSTCWSNTNRAEVEMM